MSTAALQALKRKKRYEKQLTQIDGTLSTIEMQREALENANTNTAVLTTMKNAADALKSAHKNMNVDDVHDMMDDIAEQNDMANEISTAISSAVGFGQDVDDEELEKELEELEQEELDKELLGVQPETDQLPDVPSTDLPSKAKEKEKKKGELVTIFHLFLHSFILCPSQLSCHRRGRGSGHEGADVLGELRRIPN